MLLDEGYLRDAHDVLEELDAGVDPVEVQTQLAGEGFTLLGYQGDHLIVLVLVMQSINIDLTVAKQRITAHSIRLIKHPRNQRFIARLNIE